MNYVDVTDSAEASIWSDSPSAHWGMWKSIMFHNLKQPSKLFVTVQSAASVILNHGHSFFV